MKEKIEKLIKAHKALIFTQNKETQILVDDKKGNLGTKIYQVPQFLFSFIFCTPKTRNYEKEKIKNY